MARSGISLFKDFSSCHLAMHGEIVYIGILHFFCMNLEEKKEVIRDYLRKNRTATSTEIRHNLSLRADKIYRAGGIKMAYQDAGVPLPNHLLKRTRKEIHN